MINHIPKYYTEGRNVLFHDKPPAEPVHILSVPFKSDTLTPDINKIPKLAGTFMQAQDLARSICALLNAAHDMAPCLPCNGTGDINGRQCSACSGVGTRYSILTRSPDYPTPLNAFNIKTTCHSQQQSSLPLSSRSSSSPSDGAASHTPNATTSTPSTTTVVLPRTPISSPDLPLPPTTSLLKPKTIPVKNQKATPSASSDGTLKTPSTPSSCDTTPHAPWGGCGGYDY